MSKRSQCEYDIVHLHVYVWCIRVLCVRMYLYVDCVRMYLYVHVCMCMHQCECVHVYNMHACSLEFVLEHGVLQL